MATHDDSARRPRFLAQMYANYQARNRRYGTILVALTALAAILYTLPFWIALHQQLQNLSQAVADALVVAIVVSLAVEPRLLRYFGEELRSFGEELGTQTFWSSFYSRAPRVYIDAVKQLAEAEQFTIASNWIASFDWANHDKTVLRLSVDHANYRENRSSREFPVITKTFIYESPVDTYKSQIRRQAVICESIEFYSDLIKDGRAIVEPAEGGMIRIRPSDASTTPFLIVPPGERFTVLTSAETYVPKIGYFPLMINTPALRLTVEFKGDALEDLDISITPAGIFPVIRGSGGDFAQRGPIEVGGVYVNGQGVLLSWAPHLHPASIPTEGSNNIR